MLRIALEDPGHRLGEHLSDESCSSNCHRKGDNGHNLLL